MDIRYSAQALLARWIKLALVIAMLSAAFAVLGETKAHAAKLPLDIMIEQGFDGKLKEGKWAPVKMTVTNPGDDVSGDLTIQMTGDDGKNIVFAKHVDLPRQSTKIVWFTIPGKSLNQNNNKVLFYDKSVDKGEPLPFSQEKVSIQSRPVPPGTLVVGILARDPDTLNFLSLLNQKGYQIQTTQLTAGDFPWESGMLDGLDVIALNDTAGDALKPEHVKGIQDWVERGGKLVLAGGAGYAKTASGFAELSPVTVGGTATVSALPEFVQAAGRELALNGTLTVSKGTVKSGDTLFAENGIPLVVSAPRGGGSITYVAYDLASQPLASWSGNPTIWERILYGSIAPASSANQRYSQQDGLWEVSNALEVFPQLVPPAYGILTLLFLAYAIVVAPALYALLKRLDRREWAWFIIPVIAIVMSLGIYGIGASGRSSTLAQTLAINELSGAGGGTRLEASSVFVPSGGNYKLEWDGRRNVTPMMNNNGRAIQNGKPDMILRSEADKTSVDFLNVPYWSMRKVFLAKETMAGPAQFDYTIRFDAAGAKGEVVNKTNQDLYEAGVLIGGQWFRIGDLRAGEKKAYQISLGSTVFMQDSQWGSYIFPYSGNRDQMSRERSLLNSYSLSRMASRQNSQQLDMYILGYAKTSGKLFKVDGVPVQSEQTELLIQPIQPDYLQGDRLFIPPGVIMPFVETSNVANMSSYYNGGIDMGSGDMTLKFLLPERSNWQYEKLTLSMAVAHQFKIELWNGNKQDWESLPAGEAVLEGRQLKDALSGGNGIRLKVTNSQNAGRYTYPTLSAEGAVKR
ncbi:hypothetical protein ACFFNY_02955 [Paenibacillus hodogayensis]|uniref:DUF7408 domain-containing protein n=1 Tax=Paenibacillus hodogayensis TaxID=279208 RepID=A0ABV5VQG9_9BACL